MRVVERVVIIVFVGCYTNAGRDFVGACDIRNIKTCIFRFHKVQKQLRIYGYVFKYY